jgi:hypothetical protein
MAHHDSSIVDLSTVVARYAHALMPMRNHTRAGASHPGIFSLRGAFLLTAVGVNIWYVRDCAFRRMSTMSLR